MLKKAARRLSQFLKLLHVQSKNAKLLLLLLRIIQFGRLCEDEQDKTLNTGIIRRMMRMYNRCKADTVIKTGARECMLKKAARDEIDNRWDVNLSIYRLSINEYV